MSATTLYRYMAARPAAIVAAMLRVLFPDARTALDLTPGRGNFWDGTAHVAVTASRADFLSLPHADGAFDVALYDPPHLADGGAGGIMAERFGTYRASDLEAVLRRGAREALRVGRLGCIVKVTDHVHGHRFWDQSGWIREELGIPYDVVHEVRARNLEDGKWRGVYSARSNGAVYLAFRHGDQRHVARRGGTDGRPDQGWPAPVPSPRPERAGPGVGTSLATSASGLGRPGPRCAGESMPVGPVPTTDARESLESEVGDA